MIARHRGVGGEGFLGVEVLVAFDGAAELAPNFIQKDYLEPNGTISAFRPQVLRLANYWTEIVSQASNYDEPTTLKCRRCYQRQGCRGPLTIFFDVDNNDVLWFCPVGDDQGRISGWEWTFWDHSELTEKTS